MILYSLAFMYDRSEVTGYLYLQKRASSHGRNSTCNEGVSFFND